MTTYSRLEHLRIVSFSRSAPSAEYVYDRHNLTENMDAALRIIRLFFELWNFLSDWVVISCSLANLH